MLLTILNLVRPLALLVNHNDDHEDDDLGQDAQERPQRGEETPHTQDGHGLFGADDVRGVADVLARVCADVQSDDTQFCEIVFVDDEEAARAVVNVLLRENASNSWQYLIFFFQCDSKSYEGQ